MSGDVRLVVFDLGRVLVRICDNWDHACELAALGVRLAERDEHRRAALHEWVCAMETGRIDTAAFCVRAADILRVRPEQVRSILDVYLIETYPGVTELIEQLGSANYLTACLTNTNTEHWNQMFDPSDRCALPMHRLSHHFASHLLGLRKPEEAIYSHVEAATGCRGEQIVLFDDMLENVQGAQARGWRAHQILRDIDPVAQMRRHLHQHGVL